jgi:hypothetical protein
MDKRWQGLAALALAGAALVAAPCLAREAAEASMLVEGEVSVAADGHVTGYTLQRGESLPPEVTRLIASAAPRWRFEPVVRDGAAVPARASMSLRLVAKPETPDAKTYVVHIVGATFGGDGTEGGELGVATRTKPMYPKDAVRGRIEGTVYVAARVGRDGKVADIDAEQVNLRVSGPEPHMKAWRAMLAQPAIQAVREWTFSMPTAGTHKDDPFYIVHVPVVFNLLRVGASNDTYGQWEAYVPGPTQDISWMKDGAVDAVPENGVYVVNTGLKLTTPVDNSQPQG